MSTAPPLTEDDRIENYVRQNRRGELTPAQLRRLRHKGNEALRPHARTGRLRRRYDRVDQRNVRYAARRMAEWVRLRRAGRL